MSAALIVLLAAALLLPASAQAEWSDKYERVAVAYWHDAPDCYTGPGSMTYTWTETLFDDPIENAEAVASSASNDCRILFKPSYWFSRAKVDRCKVFLHEWGHQIGRQHNSNPNSIMFDKPSLMLPRTCERRGWWRMPSL